MSDLTFTQGTDPVSIFNDSSGNQLAIDSSGRITANVGEPSVLNTYCASITGLVAATTPTDIFTITGSATKTIKILCVEVTVTATTAIFYNLIFLKRSTANSGGTSTNPTVVPRDSANPAGTAVVNAYTANPTTLGTLVGNTNSYKAAAATSASGQSNNIIFVKLFDANEQPMTLRGTSQVFAINLNSTSLLGSSFNISITWIEE